MAISTLYDIDFAALYKSHKLQVGRPKSMAHQWDERAKKIEVGQLESVYSSEFLNSLDLNDSDTLLDVGCGAGVIAVQVAPKVHTVYALDYSRGMLDKLKDNATYYNTHNINILCKDWDESWAEVPVCDVVVASRSTLVDDMEAALIKLSAHAKRHVYITYPSSATPSYLYILAILHQHAKAAQLRFIGPDRSWALIDWAV